jgi:hypothetical protein
MNTQSLSAVKEAEKLLRKLEHGKNNGKGESK